VLDVAVACGFKTQQHFARVFRRICGASLPNIDRHFRFRSNRKSRPKNFNQTTPCDPSERRLEMSAAHNPIPNSRRFTLLSGRSLAIAS
jgi:AraC-like DNA-binding protein